MVMLSIACRPPARSRSALGAPHLKELVPYWMCGWAVKHWLASMVLTVIHSVAEGVCESVWHQSTSALGSLPASLGTRCASETCGRTDMDLAVSHVEKCNVPSLPGVASTRPAPL